MTEWYSRIFNADYLRCYPQMDEVADSQAGDIAACLGLPAGARVLDLAGGYGRIAIPLARRGYRVTVHDLSTDLLGVGRERAAAAGVEVEWRHGDMREVPATADYDAVINIFSSFGYFERDEDNEKALHAAGGALRPGGRFLLDFINRELVLRGDPLTAWLETADTITLDRTTFDVATGRTHTQHLFHDRRTGERKDYSFSVRVYTAPEYRNMLLRAGFAGVTFYGGLDRSLLTRDSPRLVVLARK
jgi:2-polyprenyl-3-methyl-5-hydroxy-6-metoxy-1,4-benzoquinol methylase